MRRPFGSFGVGPVGSAVYVVGGLIGALILIGVVVHAGLTKGNWGGTVLLLVGLTFTFGLVALIRFLEGRR